MAGAQVSVFNEAVYFKNKGEVQQKINKPDSNLRISNYPIIKSIVDVAAMNYSDIDSVLRYKKLEFGIELPSDLITRINQFLHQKGDYSDELNPFLEWNIDVEATFYHPETGTIKNVDGFYTREYKENKQTDDWDELNTDYPFRIRFAPPLIGEWKVVIHLRINNETEPSIFSSDFWFNVIESGDLGYVKVYENGRNFKQGDQMIYPIGTNFPADFPCVAWGGTCFDPIPGDEVRMLNGSDTIYYGHNLYSNKNT